MIGGTNGTIQLGEAAPALDRQAFEDRELHPVEQAPICSSWIPLPTLPFLRVQ